MKLLPFKSSALVSLGLELELQIINPHSYGLVSRAKDLIRNIREEAMEGRIKPEITQSMIEINSSIHHSPRDMMEELSRIHRFLLNQEKKLNVYFCGGGTHPFQKWAVQKIFPIRRYKKLSRQYRYLSKRSTVFGQHVHVGCPSGEEAIYLTHALARYIPQFIAISASSPFCEGIDTHYFSSRITVFNAFPLSGVIPYLTTWEEFSAYFYKMKNLGIIETMKDFYWDIRPKPEFGTVEIRICDTPLTIKKAILIVAYIQALSLYLLTEKPYQVTQDLYHIYNYNRFQASRYGFDGDFIHPLNFQHGCILDDIQETVKQIEHYANKLGNMIYITQLMNDVINKRNDTVTLREKFKQVNSLAKVVEEQCRLWEQPTENEVKG